MKYATAGQRFVICVRNTNGLVTGDAANLTCQLSIDGGTRYDLTTATPIYESDGVTETGFYSFPASVADVTGHELSITPASSVSGNECFGVPGNVIYTTLEHLIKAKTDLIVSGSVIGSGSTVSASGTIPGPLIIGDDYAADFGTEFIWIIDDPGFTSVGATCKLGFDNAYVDVGRVAPDNGSFEVSGTITDNGSTWTLTFEAAAASTGTITPGLFDWSVHVADATSQRSTRVRNTADSYRVEWVAAQTSV